MTTLFDEQLKSPDLGEESLCPSCKSGLAG
jgi:hypothetical protein